MLRMMGQGEYGLYSLVASVVSYLTMLDFGFGNAIVRYTIYIMQMVDAVNCLAFIEHKLNLSYDESTYKKCLGEE